MKRRKFLHQMIASTAWTPMAFSLREQSFNPPSARTGSPIHVGSAKQLFIDDSFVAERRGVRLVVNRPQLTGERCITADKPWEGFAVLAYNSIMEDEGVLKYGMTRSRMMGAGGAATRHRRMVCIGRSQISASFRSTAAGTPTLFFRLDAWFTNPIASLRIRTRPVLPGRNIKWLQTCDRPGVRWVPTWPRRRTACIGNY